MLTGLYFFWRVWRRILSCSFLASGVFHNPYRNLVCDNINPIFVFICTWLSFRCLWVPCLLLLKTSIIKFRIHFNPVWLNLMLVTSAKTLFPNKIKSQVLGNINLIYLTHYIIIVSLKFHCFCMIIYYLIYFAVQDFWEKFFLNFRFLTLFFNFIALYKLNVEKETNPLDIFAKNKFCDFTWEWWSSLEQANMIAKFNFKKWFN